MNSEHNVQEDYVMTDEMEKCIDLAMAGKNIFLTGKAGTGKSTLLQYLRLNVLPENHIALAPTGVAALNIGGMTVHKFFGFQPDITWEHIESARYNPRNRDIMKTLKTLIIDEVSMIRADMMDCVDRALRKYGPDRNEPFGGVQLVLVGDLFQLPPIVSRTEDKFMDTHFATPYFYSSYAMTSVEYSIVELGEVFRQKESVFVDVLNAIRTNDVTDQHLNLLAGSVDPAFVPPKDDIYITLVTTKDAAKIINGRELDKLPTKLYSSKAEISGDFSKSEYPAEVEMHFKAGANIMMLNNDADGRWVNGTLARIESVKHIEQSHGFEVEIYVEETGKKYTVLPHTWDVKRPRSISDRLVYDIVGSFTQLPFALAWAITIHKSQGKTFDRVIIDLSSPTFSTGQLYVALSRCRSLSATILRQPIDRGQIMADERISEYFSHAA